MSSSKNRYDRLKNLGGGEKEAEILSDEWIQAPDGSWIRSSDKAAKKLARKGKIAAPAEPESAENGEAPEPRRWFSRKSSAEKKREEEELRQLEAERKERLDKQQAEEFERHAERERKRKAELEREIEQERLAKLEKESAAERERQAELERERQRKADLEFMAEVERTRAREIEEEFERERARVAELQREVEQERQRQAELARKAEEERARQSELAREAERERQRLAELEREAELNRTSSKDSGYFRGSGSGTSFDEATIGNNSPTSSGGFWGAGTGSGTGFADDTISSGSSNGSSYWDSASGSGSASWDSGAASDPWAASKDDSWDSGAAEGAGSEGTYWRAPDADGTLTDLPPADTKKKRKSKAKTSPAPSAPAGPSMAFITPRRKRSAGERIVSGAIATGLVLATLAIGGGLRWLGPDPERVQRPFVTSGEQGETVSLRKFAITVQTAKAVSTVQSGGSAHDSQGVWVVLRVRVVASNEPGTVSYVALRDQSGRTFLATDRLGQPLLDGKRTFQPGIPLEGEVVFEVPKDALGGLTALFAPDPAHLSMEAMASVDLPALSVLADQSSATLGAAEVRP